MSSHHHNIAQNKSWMKSQLTKYLTAWKEQKNQQRELCLETILPWSLNSYIFHSRFSFLSLPLLHFLLLYLWGSFFVSMWMSLLLFSTIIVMFFNCFSYSYFLYYIHDRRTKRNCYAVELFFWEVCEWRLRECFVHLSG